MTTRTHRLGDVDDLHAWVDSLNAGGGWSWATLPGVEVSHKEQCHAGFFLADGILSVGQEYVADVLEGVRLGLSMVLWLRHPAIYHDDFRAAKNQASGKPLCHECDGTGNWLKSMYKKCDPCNGSGVLEPVVCSIANEEVSDGEVTP